MKVAKRGLGWILVGIIFMVVGCSPDSPEKMIPPAGWTKEAIQAPAKGIEILFAGQPSEGSAGESHLMVLHAPGRTTKENARGTIGAFLDGFWKKDPNL